MKNTYVFDRALVADELEVPMEEPIFEYSEPDHKQDLSLPMLPPPKRFLKAGSVYWVNDNIKYTFIDKDHKDIFATTIRVNKFHNIEDKKLRLLKINYYFLRDKNAMSEVKSGFRSIVYNAETKALYLIKAFPDYKESKKGNMKHRWKKSINRISINHFMLEIEIGNFDYKLREKFIRELLRIVSKDVPGVKIECNGHVASMVSLLIQHKSGRAIPGLNDICIANLSYMASHQFIDSRVSFMKRDAEGRARSISIEQREKDIRNLRKKSSYKFISTLGETNSLRKALTVLLGECYVGIFPKLIFDIGFNDLSHGQPQSIIRYKELMPKNIQHYVSQSLGKMDRVKFMQLFREVLDLGRTTVDDRIKESWIRTTRRLGEPVPWRAWSDTYRMAGQLNIRIRPNIFSNIQDIWEMHDRLSNVIQRQNRIAFGVNIGKFSRFIEVKYPKTFKNHKFRQLMTPDDLSKETEAMGHCVHSYKTDCAKGRSIIFSVIAPDGKRYTVEYSGHNFNFVQAEGSYADNGGRRNICEHPIRTGIFIPFGTKLEKHNDALSYETLSTLNLAIIESEQDVDALESILELNDDLGDDISDNICRRNSLLEDLLTIRRDVHNGEYKNSPAIITAVEAAIEKCGFDNNNPRPKPVPQLREIDAEIATVPLNMGNPPQLIQRTAPAVQVPAAPDLPLYPHAVHPQPDGFNINNPPQAVIAEDRRPIFDPNTYVEEAEEDLPY